MTEEAGDSIMVQTRNTTITIPINDAIETDLRKFAKEQGKDPERVVRDLIVEWLEDQADIQAAERVIAEGNPTIPWEEVKRQLDLED
jgi:hypothetical protein